MAARTRIKGHKLSTEWNRERGVESSTTGTCICGNWEESCSSQSEVRFEYREHLASVERRQKAAT